MKWDEQAMNESFYLSNMVPQSGSMNSGIWRMLESKVQKWAKGRGGVFVYTGPVYLKDKKTKVVGTNKVAVPDMLFKIVFDPNKPEAIAFVMPNRKLNTVDMPKYLVSIEKIEAMTGLDFLSVLELSIEKAVESEKAKVIWQ